jgi:probable addiction module antidote protein
MSKAAPFNAAKYRSNPKAIANYLNDALATDDSAFVRALGNLARAHAVAEEANVDRAGLYSLRGDMDPAFGTVLKVLAALGIQLVAKPAAGL